MESDQRRPPSPRIPTSVVEFQRAASAGGLHFRYDMSAVAAAAATTETDEVVKQLREDSARLTRRLARAQADGQRLMGELGQAQRENQRLGKELNAVRAQNSQATLVAQKARDERFRAEEQLRMAQSINTSLITELNIAQQALNKERGRTVAAVSSIARLRAERVVLRQDLPMVLPSVSTTLQQLPSTTPEAPDVPMDDVEKVREHVEKVREHVEKVREYVAPESPAPSPPASPAVSSTVPSPLVSVRSPPVATASPPLLPPPLSSPSPASPPLASPALATLPPPSPAPPPPPFSPRQRPLSSATSVHRPSVTSSVPRPFFGKLPSSSDVGVGGSNSSSSSSTSPPKFVRKPQSTPSVSPDAAKVGSTQPRPARSSSSSSAPGSPTTTTLKRKRSRDDADAEDDVVFISRTGQGAAPLAPKPTGPVLRGWRAGPGPGEAAGDGHGHGAGEPGPQWRSHAPASSSGSPPGGVEIVVPRPPAPPAPAPSAPNAAPAPAIGVGTGKLGISHLPLLYETQGANMYCRACRRSFAPTAPWADLAGHWQSAHAEACKEIEALRPAQVLEQSQRLKYLGSGKR